MVCLLHQIVAICSNRASDLVQLNTIRQHLRSNTCQDNLAKHRVRYLEAKLDADRIHYRFMVERIENTFQPGSDAQPVFRRSLDIQTIRLNMPPKPKDPKKSLEPEGLVFSNDHDVFEPGSNEESDFESESEETDSEDNQPKLKLKKKQKGSFPRPALHKRLVENFKDVSPRSKYSDEVQQYLRRWLADHRDSPYPSLGEKKAIAKRIGLSLTQVTNWYLILH
ncbi:hypothetical protein EDD86DRAFT_217706 [Gorgonomyces haynaldii]|nr:hypothetical protein EDD86DRAFT_217706 [Gorgonomyces haynaldii]